MVGKGARQPSWLMARFAPMLPYHTKHLDRYAAVPCQVDRRESARRRLSDKVETSLHLACAAGDLAVASRLLGVLEAVQKRSRERAEGDRRAASLAVVRGRRTIAALAAALFSDVAASEA